MRHSQQSSMIFILCAEWPPIAQQSLRCSDRRTPAHLEIQVTVRRPWGAQKLLEGAFILIISRRRVRDQAYSIYVFQHLLAPRVLLKHSLSGENPWTTIRSQDRGCECKHEIHGRCHHEETACASPTSTVSKVTISSVVGHLIRNVGPPVV